MDLRLKGKPGWVKIWLASAIPGVLYYFVKSFILDGFDFTVGELAYITYGFLSCGILVLMYGFKKAEQKGEE